jgi:hypothetical protein
MDGTFDFNLNAGRDGINGKVIAFKSLGDPNKRFLIRIKNT